MDPQLFSQYGSAFVVMLIASTFHWTNYKQALPYMDELFHIPQAIRFCNLPLLKNLSYASIKDMWSSVQYDPAITTPPALYIIPAIVKWLTGNMVDCDPSYLRMFTAFFAILLFNEVKLIVHAKYHNHYTQPAWFLYSLTLWLNPFAFFYYNLYYTDTMSLYLVMLSWRLSIQNKQMPSALVGLIATLGVRQTNIIWHFYIACTLLIDKVIVFDTAVNQNRPAEAQAQSSPPLSLVTGSGQTESWQPTQSVAATGIKDIDPSKHIPASSKYKAASFWNIKVLDRDNWKNIIIANWKEIIPHLSAGVLYVLAYWFNGGIAIGDKTNHDPQLHLAMILYFSVFRFFTANAFSTSLLSLFLKRGALTSAVQRIFHPKALLQLWALIGAVVAAIKFGTVVHSFILSDNRHYTFYIYRKIILRSSWSRYLPMPVYAISLFSLLSDIKIFQLDAPTTQRLKGMIYFVCCFIGLVPTPLLEFRYFLVAYLIVQIEFAVTPRDIGDGNDDAQFIKAVILALIISFSLSLLMIYIFLEFPFERPVDLHMISDISPGRFMP